MAIINNSHGFVFIHVPKVAGTTVTNVLSKYTNYCDLEIGSTAFGEAIQKAYLERFRLSKHSTARHLKSVIGAELWKEKFTFGFSRNPYDRAISTYYFLKQWKSCPEEVKREILKFESFEEFVLSEFWNNYDGPDKIFKPQTHWLCGGKNNSDILVNFVGRLETIGNDFNYILKKILKDDFYLEETLPNLNKSKKRIDSKIKDKQVVRIINDKYHIDFETFNYEIL